MSFPESGRRPPGSAPGAGPGQPDSGTDPGRAQPYESLYRAPEHVSNATHRTTARHFEPWLTPPEGEPQTEDTFHWLYRPEPAGASVAAAPQPPAPAAESPAAAPVPPAEEPPGPAAAVGPPRRGRRRTIWLVVVLAVVLTLVGAAVVAEMAGASKVGGSQASGSDPSSGPGSGSATPGPGPASGTVQPSTSASGRPAYTGIVAPVKISSVSASCRAPSSTDGSGRRVRYDPKLVDDDDPSTAWRCNGDGVGESLVFTFGRPTRIAALGLLNGYSRVDRATGDHRYGEYRRVTRVTWTFPDGTSIVEPLQDDVESAQTMRIPVLETDQVTLTVTRTTAPGSRARSRDAVLISEATFAGPLH